MRGVAEATAGFGALLLVEVPVAVLAVTGAGVRAAGAGCGLAGTVAAPVLAVVAVRGGVAAGVAALPAALLVVDRLALLVDGVAAAPVVAARGVLPMLLPVGAMAGFGAGFAAGFRTTAGADEVGTGSAVVCDGVGR